jgi:hypothetical protein
MMVASAGVVTVAGTLGTPGASGDRHGHAATEPLVPGSGGWIEARRAIRHVLCDEMTAILLADRRMLIACPQPAGDSRWFIAYPDGAGVRDIDAHVAEALATGEG